MDNSSPPLEVDYAERVAANCNMDIEITDPSLPSAENATCFSFSLPASNPCVPLEEVPNSATTSNIDISTEPSPLEVIPYSTNVPADPSLWDGNFTATSLFGTNKFLNSDINNIMCSLKRMACFLRQQNVKDQDANNIRQLDPFGKSAWDFVSAIFESGWDTLITANKSSIRDNFAKEFGETTKPSPSVNICHGAYITKVPPPIPPCPSKEILEKSKAHQQKISTEGKSPLPYTQIVSNVTNCQGRVEREWSDLEWSGVTLEWKRFDNKSGGTTLASARALCLNRLSRVWLRISGGLNCCQESQSSID